MILPLASGAQVIQWQCNKNCWWDFAEKTPRGTNYAVVCV